MELEALHQVQGVQGSSYPIYLGEGLLDDALPNMIVERGYTNIAIATNETLEPLYGKPLVKRLREYDSYMIVLPDDEKYSGLNTVHIIFNQLLLRNADRSTVIVALGGRVIIELVSFVGATYMYGVDVINCPTTPLAMVDTSIGGKGAIDLPQGRNLIGTFKDPIAVFADLQSLETLPVSEMRNGLAGIVKTALVGDPDLIDMLTPDDQSRLAYRPERLRTIIERAMAVKVPIVEADHTGLGERLHLNLGYTFAFALEKATGYKLPHGEALAVGLVAAVRLSHRMGLCDAALVQRTEQVLQSLNPSNAPVSYAIPQGRAIDVWEAMRHDPKWRQGKARFVLLQGPGQPIIHDDVPQELVLEVIESLADGVYPRPRSWRMVL
ncbi:MAG: 3-dehydroquinate synthase [Chloroflexi bacterium]|nr:3-dehydroquinate synthase [Chloroflexota bacterium]